ncbi:MAG: DUF937 domain-containing protein [Leadbetterella sp.]
MNLKPQISTKSIQDVANFLGEDFTKVQSSLDTASSTFLGMIISYGSDQKGAESLLQILNQGGHSGDIISNFNDLSSNPEKLQLLSKIGSNIIQHFGSDKTAYLVDTISNLNGVRKTSIDTILNLVGPLGLGQIGKQVSMFSLTSSSLMELLNSQKDVLSISLPPAIVDQLGLKEQRSTGIFNIPQQENVIPPSAQATQVPNSSTTQTTAKPKPKKKAFPWIPVFAWSLLLIVGAFGFLSKTKDFSPYFSKIKGVFSSKSDSLSVNDSTLVSKNAADYMPKDENYSSVNSSNKVVPTENSSKDDAIPSASVPSPPIQAKSVPVAKSENINTTSSKATEKKSNSQFSDDNASEKSSKKRESTKTDSDFSNHDNHSEASEPQGKMSDGWQALTGSIFSSGSAEIKNSEVLEALVEKAKTSGIVISPTSSKSLAEDRAYAIREFIIQKGVSSSKVTVGKYIKGSSSSLVAYKTN